MILELLGLAAMAGVGGFLYWERHDMAVAHVYAALRGVKATNIKISPDWLDCDRDAMTYDVEYTAADGSRKSNTCKVYSRPGCGEGVFWARPL